MEPFSDHQIKVLLQGLKEDPTILDSVKRVMMPLALEVLASREFMRRLEVIASEDGKVTPTMIRVYERSKCLDAD